MARLQIVGLPSYNRARRNASINSSGNAKKDAASAASTSGPAKEAKSAASSSQGAGKQEESELKFQALRDSMPSSTIPEVPTAASTQGEHASSTQPKPDDHNQANASGESKPAEKKADATADEGATGKGSGWANWSTKKKVIAGLSAVAGLWIFSKIVQGGSQDSANKS